MYIWPKSTITVDNRNVSKCCVLDTRAKTHHDADERQRTNHLWAAATRQTIKIYFGFGFVTLDLRVYTTFSDENVRPQPVTLAKSLNTLFLMVKLKLSIQFSRMTRARAKTSPVPCDE